MNLCLGKQVRWVCALWELRTVGSHLLTRLEVGWFVVSIVSSSGRMGFQFLLLRNGRRILRAVLHGV